MATPLQTAQAMNPAPQDYNPLTGGGSMAVLPTTPATKPATPTTPVEPTVISSDQSGKIADITSKVQSASTKGATMGPNGETINADGTVTPPKSTGGLTSDQMQAAGISDSTGWSFDSNTGLYTPPSSPNAGVVAKSATPGQANTTDPNDPNYVLNPKSAFYDPLYFQKNPDQDPSVIANKQILADTKAQMDAAGAAQISAIQSQYEALIAQQKDANASAEASRNTSLITGGTQRYAQLDSTGIMNTQIGYGLQQVSDLVAKEGQAVAQAQQAIADNDYKLADKLMAINDATAKTRNDTMAQIAKDLQTQKDELTKNQQDQATALQTEKNKLMDEIGKNGSLDAQTAAAIGNATTYDQMYAAVAGKLDTTATTGVVGEYNYYVKQSKANGVTPLSFVDYQREVANMKVPKVAPSSIGGTTTITDPNGNNITVPTDAAPYYNTSHSGVGYIDASSLQGTAAEKKAIIDAAQAAGIKVITNKNNAADLQNISTALEDADTIQKTFTDIATSDPTSRAMYEAGTNTLSEFLQADPNKAAAGVFNSVSLDMLKAVSGIQGFRGGQSIVTAVQKDLPTITDTIATVKQKMDNFRTLIQNREDALVGKNSAGKLVDQQKQDKQSVTDYGTSNPSARDAITKMLSTVNTKTGQPFTYSQIKKALNIQ